MPPAPLPPMTTRQAKKLGKKNAAQFQYTSSQMRRADRREALENRKKREEEKECKKIQNKRMREEQEEKDRAVKRRLFEEGKIRLEDTWGKVTASQPRLNNFFKAPSAPNYKANPAPGRTPSANAGGVPIVRADNKENEDHSQDLQEEISVNQATVVIQPRHLGDEISDVDLLKLLSSQPHLPQQTPPDSVKRTPQTRSRTRNTASTVRTMSPSILKRKRSLSPKPARDQENDFPDGRSDAEPKVAEDETAEEASGHAPEVEGTPDSFSSPSKSFRSVLSEMSVVNVNTRAQEKPDVTSTNPNNELPTPSKPRDPFAEFNSGDFVDDDELTWNKENSDPLQTPEKAKAKAKDNKDEAKKIEAGPSSSPKQDPPLGFGDQNDFEDIYEFDFDNGDDDFDDEVDDATLLTFSTQKPRGDKIVDMHGSPRKLTPNRDALVKPAPLTFTPGRMMPPPPSTSKLATPKRRQAAESSTEKRLESLSFASVGDDDLLEIAEQVEEELSQKSQKGKAVALEFKVPAARKKRPLPWNWNPVPPPSTQDYLMMMADEVDAELDG